MNQDDKIIDTPEAGILKDSGSRTEFTTGAVRDTAEGKGRMDLLPFNALLELAKLYEAGCQKYGERNWEQGIPITRYIDSALRHLSKVMIGETDEPHLVQAAWNIMGAIETLIKISEGKLSDTLFAGLPFPEVKLMNGTVNTRTSEPADRRTAEGESQ